MDPTLAFLQGAGPSSGGGGQFGGLLQMLMGLFGGGGGQGQQLMQMLQQHFQGLGGAAGPPGGMQHGGASTGPSPLAPQRMPASPGDMTQQLGAQAIASGVGGGNGLFGPPSPGGGLFSPPMNQTGMPFNPYMMGGR